MVERLDPDSIDVLHGSPGDKERHIQSDFLIRSGMCPNGHGLLMPNEYGQECPVCGFSCNISAEIPQQ